MAAVTDNAFLSDYDSEEEEEHEPVDEFWYEELVWPDPCGFFPATSGITPMDLHHPKPALTGGQACRTLCDRAKKVFKPPRPTELPWNIHMVSSDPPAVDEDEVEEFLVHDPLFVEFFNAFLSLPSFPEPICFNVSTGGFEVVSDGKQKLARQIKEAVRSQQMTARMYRVVRQHAFSDIPIIPIEDMEGGPEEVKIDTSYQVTTLNKDQGIYWIRAERLPIFLESDFYFTYRLAKVISQARLFNDTGEYVVMKLDFTPRPKKVKKTVEQPPPNPEEEIIKRMFISFGDVRGAAKEAYFTQAMEEMKTDPTYTTLNKATKHEDGNHGDGDTSPSLKVAERPKSSVFHSQFFGEYSPGLAGPTDANPPINDDKNQLDRMYNPPVAKPHMPRPSEKVHSATASLRKPVSKTPGADEEMVNPGAVIKVWPKHGNVVFEDDESGVGDMDYKEESLDKKMMQGPIIDEIYNDGTWEMDEGNIILHSRGDLASVIVGAVMKKTMADLLNMDEKDVVKDPKIGSLYPSDSLTCLSVDKLELCVVEKREKKDKKEKKEKKEKKDKKVQMAMDEESDFSKDSKATDRATDSMRKNKCSKPHTITTENKADIVKEPVHVKWEKKMHKPYEEESDADSLLDSDEDFEERDDHFRRNKDKWHSLTSIKGIMAFKNFLKGTTGEKYWELWVDIDKGHLITDEEEKQQFTMLMRNRYYKGGSYYELSIEDKKKLGLENLSSWVPEYLFQVHARVLEPLILYWAPRYLLKHLVRAHPERHAEYNQIMSVCPSGEADPHPHTRALLPLGPKSCCPRSRDGPGLGERPQSSIYRYNEAEFVTTPKVGNRRVYGADTLKRLERTPTAKYLGLKPRPPASARPQTAVEGKGRSAGRRASMDSSSTQVLQKPGKKNSVKITESVPGSQEDINGRLSGVASKKMVGKDNSFVGRLPEVESKTRKLSNTPPGSTSSLSKVRPATSCAGGRRPPCPSRPLTAVLGEPGVPLPIPRKPKDLLTPMLKIVTTDEKKRRVQSAVDRNKSEEDRKTTFYRQDSQESSKSCDQSVPGGVPCDAVGPTSMEFTEITDCDFMGSERMEFLLQALHHEQSSGKTFRKYIEKSERSLWCNNLDFWEQVQEYRKLFYMDKLDLFLISKMAKSIFAKCVVDGSSQNIGVSDSIELHVMEHLHPAYEDLFDQAEEHALKVLFEAFQLYLSQDVKTYCKVERTDVTRRLETKNTYILNLQKQGIIKEGPLTPDDPMEGYVEPVCDESLLDKIPEQYKDWNLDKLLHNRLELEAFRQYLADNYAEVDLKCWMDMEAWRRTPPEDDRKRDQRSRDIKKNYLNRKYFFGPSSPAGKEGQNKVMEVGGGWGKFLEDKPQADSILLAQKYVRERLEKKHMPLFLMSQEFQARQSPRPSMADSAEDVMVQKKRRSQAVLKVTLKQNEDKFYRLLDDNISADSKPPSYSIFPLINLVREKERAGLLNIPTRSSSPSSGTTNLPPLGPPGLPGAGIKEALKMIAVAAKRSNTLQEAVSASRGIKSSAHPTNIKYQSRGKFLLESKWVSSTKEIFLFKHSLQNPITCKLFRKYVGLKGDNLENDVLFWLEVQNYKKMNHTHTEDSNLNQKISAIIHCFLDSTIPPSLQIDIPQEMAERILDHKHEKSPYLFREAQLATFRILLTHWQPFMEWRNNMNSDDRALTTLERHRIISKQRESQRRDDMEEQKEREKLLRMELGLGENDELPDDLFDDEEKADKIVFSYAEYMTSMREQFDGENAEMGSFYNLNLRSFDDNASQTVRGIPEFFDQPIEDRPGYDAEEAENLTHRMMNYTKEDMVTYYNYLTKGKAPKNAGLETQLSSGQRSGDVTDQTSSD